MTAPSEEYSLLIAAATPVDAELAKSLLEAEGIPCLFHAQDRDFAELGEAVHMAISRPDVYVPNAALDSNRASNPVPMCLRTASTMVNLPPDTPALRPAPSPPLGVRSQLLDWS